MRLSLCLLMLILLPVATGVHAWLFSRDTIPHLIEEAEARLKAAGIHDPVIDLRCYDITITGEAPDPAAKQRALTALRTLVPLRLQPTSDRIHIPPTLTAKLDPTTLHLTGWLPDASEIKNIHHLLTDLRPDLQIDTTALRTAPDVQWPEGTKLPLTPGSPLLQPIITTLRVPAELHIHAQDAAIVLTGLLPDQELKTELVDTLAEIAGPRVVDPAALKASPHVQPADFAKPELLAAFVKSFFTFPPPRSFDIQSDGIPHLTGYATRQSESTWLTLLRPITGAAKVEAHFTFVPSLYHCPGYQIQSKVPPAVLDSLREALRSTVILFDPGSARIPSHEQTKLASLASALLAAGPALGLVIGAHPDPAGTGSVETALGKARADAVLSFLVEQGVPTTDISAMVFSAVPADSPSAPVSPRSVELLIK